MSAYRAYLSETDPGSLLVVPVNRALPSLPSSHPFGYRVLQEVDTVGPDGASNDITDIALTSPAASLVVENSSHPTGTDVTSTSTLPTARPGTDRAWWCSCVPVARVAGLPKAGNRQSSRRMPNSSKPSQPTSQALDQG